MRNFFFCISNSASLSNLCYLIYTYISFFSVFICPHLHIMFSNNDSLSKRKEPWANTIRWWLREQKEDNSQLLVKVIKTKSKKREAGGRKRQKHSQRENEWLCQPISEFKQQPTPLGQECAQHSCPLFPFGAFFHDQSAHKIGVGRGNVVEWNGEEGKD